MLGPVPELLAKYRIWCAPPSRLIAPDRARPAAAGAAVRLLPHVRHAALLRAVPAEVGRGRVPAGARGAGTYCARHRPESEILGSGQTGHRSPACGQWVTRGRWSVGDQGPVVSG